MKRRGKFSLIYWSVLFSVLVFTCFVKGQEKFGLHGLAKGKVIDQVRLQSGRGKYRRDVMRPQIIFPLGDTSYIFTDENTKFENGENVDVIYPKEEPRYARVYTFWFWVDFGTIVPFLLIGGFIFSILIISFTDYGRKPVILKGELDEFTKS